MNGVGSRYSQSPNAEAGSLSKAIGSMVVRTNADAGAAPRSTIRANGITWTQMMSMGSARHAPAKIQNFASRWAILSPLQPTATAPTYVEWVSRALTAVSQRTDYSSRNTRSRRSCRSCASSDMVAIGRASNRRKPIGSPVSSQKP
jgi:hypothetical protein